MRLIAQRQKFFVFWNLARRSCKTLLGGECFQPLEAEAMVVFESPCGGDIS